MNGRILIIDDDPIAMGMVDGALTAGGFEVVRAYGAEDALRKVKLRKPDLVLTDLEMPKIDGAQLITMIKEDPAAKGTPILAVTAHTWDSFGDAARRAGCDGYVGKPFSPQVLIERVAKHIARSRDTRGLTFRKSVDLEESRPVAPAPVCAPPANSEAPAPVPGTVDTAASFDSAAFLGYVDNNFEHAQQAIETLQATLPGHLESVRRAVTVRDGALLRTAAHTVKGGVAFLAAPSAVAAALRLELIGPSGDFTEAGTAFFDLERTLTRLVELLNAFMREYGMTSPVPDAVEAHTERKPPNGN